MLIVYSGLQFLEGNVLTPFIVGGKVRLFPLTVMVAFIFWGLLWGVPGGDAGGAADLRDQGRVRARQGAGRGSRGCWATPTRRRDSLVQVPRTSSTPSLFFPSDRRLPRNPAAAPTAGSASARSASPGSPTQKRESTGCGSRDEQVRRGAVRGVEQRRARPRRPRALEGGVEPEGRADRAFGRAHQPHDLDLVAVEVEGEPHGGGDRENRGDGQQTSQEETRAAQEPDAVAELRREFLLRLGRLDSRPGRARPRRSRGAARARGRGLQRRPRASAGRAPPSAPRAPRRGRG